MTRNAGNLHAASIPYQYQAPICNSNNPPPPSYFYDSDGYYYANPWDKRKIGPNHNHHIPSY